MSSPRPSASNRQNMANTHNGWQNPPMPRPDLPLRYGVEVKAVLILHKQAVDPGLEHPAESDADQYIELRGETHGDGEATAYKNRPLIIAAQAFASSSKLKRWLRRVDKEVEIIIWLNHMGNKKRDYEKDFSGYSIMFDDTVQGLSQLDILRSVKRRLSLKRLTGGSLESVRGLETSFSNVMTMADHNHEPRSPKSVDFQSHGIEMMTPVHDVNDPLASQEIGQYIKALKGSNKTLHNALVNESCGIHVNISASIVGGVAGLEDTTAATLFLMMTLYEEQLDTLFPQSRRVTPINNRLRHPHLWSIRDWAVMERHNTGKTGWPHHMVMDSGDMSAVVDYTNHDREEPFRLRYKPLEAIVHDIYGWNRLQFTTMPARRLDNPAKLEPVHVSKDPDHYGWGLDDAIKDHPVTFWASNTPNTLEFRQHEGCLDGRHVRYWVQFCAAIVRAAAKVSESVQSRDDMVYDTKEDEHGCPYEVPNPRKTKLRQHVLLHMGNFWETWHDGLSIYDLFDACELDHNNEIRQHFESRAAYYAVPPKDETDELSPYSFPDKGERPAIPSPKFTSRPVRSWQSRPPTWRNQHSLDVPHPARSARDPIDSEDSSDEDFELSGRLSSSPAYASKDRANALNHDIDASGHEYAPSGSAATTYDPAGAPHTDLIETTQTNMRLNEAAIKTYPNTPNTPLSPDHKTVHKTNKLTQQTPRRPSRPLPCPYREPPRRVNVDSDSSEAWGAWSGDEPSPLTMHFGHHGRHGENRRDSSITLPSPLRARFRQSSMRSPVTPTAALAPGERPPIGELLQSILAQREDETVGRDGRNDPDAFDLHESAGARLRSIADNPIVVLDEDEEDPKVIILSGSTRQVQEESPVQRRADASPITPTRGSWYQPEGGNSSAPSKALRSGLSQNQASTPPPNGTFETPEAGTVAYQSPEGTPSPPIPDWDSEDEEDQRPVLDTANSPASPSLPGSIPHIKPRVSPRTSSSTPPSISPLPAHTLSLPRSLVREVSPGFDKVNDPPSLSSDGKRMIRWVLPQILPGAPVLTVKPHVFSSLVNALTDPSRAGPIRYIASTSSSRTRVWRRQEALYNSDNGLHRGAQVGNEDAVGDDFPDDLIAAREEYLRKERGRREMTSGDDEEDGEDGNENDDEEDSDEDDSDNEEDSDDEDNSDDGKDSEDRDKDESADSEDSGDGNGRDQNDGIDHDSDDNGDHNDNDDDTGGAAGAQGSGQQIVSSHSRPINSPSTSFSTLPASDPRSVHFRAPIEPVGTQWEQHKLRGSSIDGAVVTGPAARQLTEHIKLMRRLFLERLQRHGLQSSHAAQMQDKYGAERIPLSPKLRARSMLSDVSDLGIGETHVISVGDGTEVWLDTANTEVPGCLDQGFGPDSNHVTDHVREIFGEAMRDNDLNGAERQTGDENGPEPLPEKTPDTSDQWLQGLFGGAAVPHTPPTRGAFSIWDSLTEEERVQQSGLLRSRQNRPDLIIPRSPLIRSTHRLFARTSIADEVRSSIELDTPIDTQMTDDNEPDTDAEIPDLMDVDYDKDADTDTNPTEIPDEGDEGRPQFTPARSASPPRKGQLRIASPPILPDTENDSGLRGAREESPTPIEPPERARGEADLARQRELLDQLDLETADELSSRWTVPCVVMKVRLPSYSEVFRDGWGSE